MTPRLGALALVPCLLAGLGACSSIENLASGDKVDYRSAGTKTSGLEVPPDLTQLSRDARYSNASGSVSAAAYQSAQPAAAATTTALVAPAALPSVRIERGTGQERWLVTSLPADQLWPQLQAFWKERGFALVADAADAGVMETDWAENRAKLPKDFIRSTLGSLVDPLYSTGERDKFRTRVERTANGTEVYISHRGLVEVYSGDRKETTVWQNRPSDPQLEAEMLQRLLVKLGTRDDGAKTTVAGAAASAGGTAATGATAASTTPARARIVSGAPAATLQVDEGFDRAWRRVGLALDRSGFTVEDRDRTQGLYFVRYVDPSQAGKEEPNFFSKLFSFGKKEGPAGPARYRVAVKAEGERSTVSVQNSQGGPENGDAGKRIVGLLLEDLR